MATAVEYGLVAAGISVAIIAVVNVVSTRTSKPVDSKPPAVTVVNMVPVRPAAGPVDIGTLLVPDLNYMDVWPGKAIAKN